MWYGTENNFVRSVRKGARQEDDTLNAAVDMARDMREIKTLVLVLPGCEAFAKGHWVHLH